MRHTQLARLHSCKVSRHTALLCAHLAHSSANDASSACTSLRLAAAAYVVSVRLHSCAGETQSEGGFGKDKVSSAALLDVQEATDKSGKTYYKYDILTRTGAGRTGEQPAASGSCYACFLCMDARVRDPCFRMSAFLSPRWSPTALLSHTCS